MPEFHIVLNADIPADGLDIRRRDNPLLILCDGWHKRSSLGWDVVEVRETDTIPNPTRSSIDLSFASDRTPGCIATLVIGAKIAGTDAIQAIDRLKAHLDLPASEDLPAIQMRKKPGSGFLDMPTITKLRDRQVIGPMNPEWPIGRRLTDHSTHLGSYGQGGIGLAGWQLNAGSWIVLPISGSSSWITLRTIEIKGVDRDPTGPSMRIEIDSRILGAHPDQIVDFPPWEHRYAGSSPDIDDLPDFKFERRIVTAFEARSDGFRMEASNGMDQWIFEMGDHLPRPAYAGILEPRLLDENVDVGASFVMTHDCHLDV